MLNAFDEYTYLLVDCPPNKMYLTQGMLRAAAYYMIVVIRTRCRSTGFPG
jgi:cellulose biosynthesis protein BcsQ